MSGRPAGREGLGRRGDYKGYLWKQDLIRTVVLSSYGVKVTFAYDSEVNQVQIPALVFLYPPSFFHAGIQMHSKSMKTIKTVNTLAVKVRLFH